MISTSAPNPNYRRERLTKCVPEPVELQHRGTDAGGCGRVRDHLRVEEAVVVREMPWVGVGGPWGFGPVGAEAGERVGPYDPVRLA
ncbi:hypothetical protein Vqi01_58920 [Micromonospora qiuiae]|uniref:Uncharacterized protein n=1 Tax=Micromonospora qiuiae TaxID=502268 RepID=A0ABQ4JJF0_9ACTN|nr:hypothetical protein Vqi01_58920 [Micromonospora qiuiae]